MVVTCTWANVGGTALADPYDHGNIGNGSGASALDIYLFHDGTAKITDCGLYIQAYSGTGYTGAATPALDYTELLDWGGSSTGGGTSTDDGGAWINQNEAGTFPDTSYEVHNATQGVLDSEFGLSTDCVATADEIQAAETAHFRMKLRVPASEAVAGARFFDQCLSYTYTS